MAKAISTNKTKYTKQFQKKVAFLNSISKDKIMIPVFLMMVNMFTGAVALRRDPTSINGWVMMLLGFIVIPMAFVLIPYFITLSGYKSMTKDSEDGSFYLEAEFTSTVMRLKNSLGQVHNVIYENIYEVSTNKNIMIIKENNSRNPIYLDTDSFKEGTCQEVKEFLDSKIQENNEK